MVSVLENPFHAARRETKLAVVSSGWMASRRANGGKGKRYDTSRCIGIRLRNRTLFELVFEF